MGSVITLHDITQQKQLEKQLIQAHKMEAIGTLAGGIAHDFNNILSAIIGYSEISLPETSPGSLVNGNLKKVLSAGERARDLVKQILTFSRQNDQEKLPVKIVPIVKEVVKFLRRSAVCHPLRLRVVEFLFRVEAAHIFHCVAFFGVIEVWQVGDKWHKVANITVAFVSDGAHHVVYFVDAVTGTEDVFSLLG